jgi:hypothetical protein
LINQNGNRDEYLKKWTAAPANPEKIHSLRTSNATWPIYTKMVVANHSPEFAQEASWIPTLA